jgi:hypothetical protein
MPPRFVAGDWFWSPLLAASVSVVALGRVDEGVVVSGWSVEDLDMPTSEEWSFADLRGQD